jgi:hypothetical protein
MIHQFQNSTQQIVIRHSMPYYSCKLRLLCKCARHQTSELVLLLLDKLVIPPSVLRIHALSTLRTHSGDQCRTAAAIVFHLAIQINKSVHNGPLQLLSCPFAWHRGHIQLTSSVLSSLLIIFPAAVPCRRRTGLCW